MLEEELADGKALFREDIVTLLTYKPVLDELDITAENMLLMLDVVDTAPEKMLLTALDVCDDFNTAEEYVLMIALDICDDVDTDAENVLLAGIDIRKDFDIPVENVLLTGLDGFAYVDIVEDIDDTREEVEVEDTIDEIPAEQSAGGVVPVRDDLMISY